MAATYSIVFITVPKKDDKGGDVAETLAESLVSAKMAACVNIVPNVSSVYRWQEKIEKSDELLLIVKTRRGLVRDLIEHVRKNHPYEVPEIIAYPIEEGNEPYLHWLGANTIFTRPRRGRKAF